MDKALCKGCLYQEPKQGGWCYMFGREPDYCLKNEEINGKLYPAIDTEHGKEIEQLRREREWLFDECVGLCFASGKDKHTEHAEKRLLCKMRQALKEE